MDRKENGNELAFDAPILLRYVTDRREHASGGTSSPAHNVPRGPPFPPMSTCLSGWCDTVWAIGRYGGDHVLRGCLVLVLMQYSKICLLSLVWVAAERLDSHTYKANELSNMQCLLAQANGLYQKRAATSGKGERKSTSCALGRTGGGPPPAPEQNNSYLVAIP